jgi:serine/threonine protein kinase
MKLEDLATVFPGITFTALFREEDDSYTIGHYVIEHLQKTARIIKSTPTIVDNIIVGFVKSGIKDTRLPYTVGYLIENLKCSPTEAQDFIDAQAQFFAVSFRPQEYKYLGPKDLVPFVVDAHTNPRAGGYGTVEKVWDGKKSYARKTINNNLDTEKIKREIEILRVATDTESPHLLQLRCAYKQNDCTYLVMHPWCDMDLGVFLENSQGITWWTDLSAENQLILISKWMACLASGLSALHKKKIKHQDLKPQTVLLDADLLPVICNFGLSKVFDMESKSKNEHGSLAYLPPEKVHGPVGRKGDIFSLGLVYVELVLLFFGKKSLKEEFPKDLYMEITRNLDSFLVKKFPQKKSRIMNGWNERFQSLIKKMLDIDPKNSYKASQVWEKAKEMVEFIKGKNHCENVSPVGSVTCDYDEKEDDLVVTLRKDMADVAFEEKSQ